MNYVALLRGINVGGKTMIKMNELKTVFEELGFVNVATYINSGNVIFESNEEDMLKLVEKIEAALIKSFKHNIRVAVKSQKEMQEIVANVPYDWNSRNDIRCYVGFLLDKITAKEAAKEISVREGIDTLKLGPSAMYMTSLLNQLTKSAFSKLASKKIYQEMTTRNYNTTKKILSLMKRN